MSEERIAQLERDVKSLQECNDAAHKEIALLRDHGIPQLFFTRERQLEEIGTFAGWVGKKMIAAGMIDQGTFWIQFEDEDPYVIVAYDAGKLNMGGRMTMLEKDPSLSVEKIRGLLAESYKRVKQS